MPISSLDAASTRVLGFSCQFAMPIQIFQMWRLVSVKFYEVFWLHVVFNRM